MSVELLNMDCMEYMATCADKSFDLAIVDPPYGINFSQYTDRIPNKKRGFTAAKLYEKSDWDASPPSAGYFKEVRRASINQIIWGGNYFADKLPPSRGWIYWDKKITNAGNTNFSDGELAWTSFNQILRKYTYDWIGFGYLNNPQNEEKIHQCQKPIALYKWLLQNYAKPGQRILDTHLGSGSSAIAAHYFGCDFVGTEIDVDYYNAAVKRFKEQTAQKVLEFK